MAQMTGQIIWLREQAEHALRLARDTADASLQLMLQASAAEYIAQADALQNGERNMPGPDPGA
jgi:hypothetical protein